MKDRPQRLTPVVTRTIVIAIGLARIGHVLELFPASIALAIGLSGAVALVACCFYALPQSMAIYFGAIGFSAIPILLSILVAIGFVDRFPALREEMNDATARGVAAITAVVVVLLLVGVGSFFVALRWLERRLR